MCVCERECESVSLSVRMLMCVYVYETDNNIGDAGATALAPSLKGLNSLAELGLTSLAVLHLSSEWVIGCVVIVDRISSDTWPLPPASYRHGVWVGETKGKHFVILVLSIYTPPPFFVRMYQVIILAKQGPRHSPLA